MYSRISKRNQILIRLSKSINYEPRTMNNEPRTRSGFTLIELTVAVGLLAMVLVFANRIFKISIETHRIAIANAEVMQKMRAITDQLNADFKGLRKDGYLVLYCQLSPARREYQNFMPKPFQMDRLYYFTTGDFQSWFAPDIRSNIAGVYFGHDHFSLYLNDRVASEWNLARDVELITAGESSLPIDCNNMSFAWRKANVSVTLDKARKLLSSPVEIDTRYPDQSGSKIESLMCQNVGEIIIEWTDGTKYPDNSLAWFGLYNQRKSINPVYPYNLIEHKPGGLETYRAEWTPTPRIRKYWPKAIRFTFTLYDSNGVKRKGRTFTHIVYLGD